MNNGAPRSKVDGIRLAALRLAALPPRDRRWILQKLEPEERKSVRALLIPLLQRSGWRITRAASEIHSLLDGIAASPVPEAQPTSAPSTEVSPAGPLERASVDELAAVLRELPPACASLLRKRLPANRHHILAAAYERASADAALPREPAVTARFLDALIASVDWRLEQRQEPGAEPGRANE